MKAAEPKSTATASKSTRPFFNKESDTSIRASLEGEGPFFPASKKKNSGIQAKLSVGRPDDHYEKEADNVADKVVHRLKDPSPPIQAKPSPHAETITPLSQNGSNKANAEEKLPIKEEERPDKEEKIQKKPIFESRADAEDDKNVQRKAENDTAPDIQASSVTPSVPSASSAIESRLAASEGSGEPLPSQTRKEMESSFGSDFSDVRVHDNSAAAQLSRDLNAQAFAHGNNIYFNSGKYNTDSTEGKHLLAHELTHTIQQGHTGRKSVQRETSNVLTGGTDTNKSTVNTNDKTIRIEKIYLPELKGRNSGVIGASLTRKAGKYDRKAAYGKGESEAKAQDEVWKEKVKTNVETHINNELLPKATNSTEEVNGVKLYYFKLISSDPKEKKGRTTNLMGTKEMIVDNVLIPGWDKKGRATAFDVDHIKELQLGGENKIDNLELLNFRVNRSSGSIIRAVIERTISQSVIELAPEKKDTTDTSATSTKPKMPSVKDAKEKHTITFSEVVYSDKESGFTKGNNDEDYWSKAQVDAGEHLKHFQPMTPEEITSAKGTAADPIIYTSEIGGKGIKKAEFEAMPGMQSINFNLPGGAAPGTISPTIKLPKPVDKSITFPIPISKMPTVIYGGNMPRIKKGAGGLEKLISKLDVPGLSPATIDSAEIVPKKGLVLRGSIQTTLEILEGVDLEFFIEGNDFGIMATISADDIKVPPPFNIKYAFLTIGAGTKGIFVEGAVFFEIKGLGQGKITGKGSSDGNFGITGTFDFDKKLFKNGASVSVEYDNKTGWTVKGKLGLGDSVKGIKKGEINVEYKDKTLTATGTAETTIKGVKSVELEVKMAEEKSEIKGKITLDKLPGIKGGEGKLKIEKKDDVYDFSGDGKVTPDIPGITTELDFTFHNDVFTVNVTIDYEKDRLKGKLKVGITNEAVDGEGKPTGKKTDGQFSVFGGGELELKVTQNIVAKAGVTLKRDGQVEVMGGIKLPGKFELIPKLIDIKNKDIIKFPGIHIPIFAIPLGGANIGLEAVITPKLQANVQVGPGSLTNTEATITYNPAKPDDLTITGNADFEFIAEAGITAGVDFAIGVSAGIASVTGGINLSAYIKAAAKQPVFHAALKYSPATGFELEGNVQAIMKAILGFSGTLFLQAEIDVWIASASKRLEKPIFKKEIDTGLDIGFEFPFSYKNGKANLTFESLKFIYPKFDQGFIETIKKNVVDPIKNQLF